MRPNQSLNQLLIDFGATGPGLRKGGCAFREIARPRVPLPLLAQAAEVIE